MRYCFRYWVWCWDQDTWALARRLSWCVQVHYCSVSLSWRWCHHFSLQQVSATLSWAMKWEVWFTCNMVVQSFLCYSVLALHELTERADCVLPVENQVWILNSTVINHINWRHAKYTAEWIDIHLNVAILEYFIIPASSQSFLTFFYRHSLTFASKSSLADRQVVWWRVAVRWPAVREELQSKGARRNPLTLWITLWPISCSIWLGRWAPSRGVCLPAVFRWWLW